jgi:hypothetical protein
VFGLSLFKSGSKTDFEQEVAARHSRNHIWRLCRRGKASFAREESSRKCAKFKVSTAKISKEERLEGQF